MAPIWGEWTDWQWDEAQARYWRARRDTQGNIEYDFNFPAPSGQAAPRDTAGDLADALSSVNISGRDATYTQEGAYTYGGSGAAGGAATAAVYGSSSAHPPIVVSSNRKPKVVAPPSKSRPKSHRDGHKENKDKSKKHRSKPEKSLADEVSETLPADDPNLRPFYGSGDPSNAEPGSVPASSTAYPTRQDPAYGSPPSNEDTPFYNRTGAAVPGHVPAADSTIQTSPGQDSTHGASPRDSGPGSARSPPGASSYATGAAPSVPTYGASPPGPGYPASASSYPTQQTPSEPAYAASPPTSAYTAGFASGGAHPYTTQQAFSQAAYGASPRDSTYASSRSPISIPFYAAQQSTPQSQYGASPRDSGYGSSLSPISGSDPRYDSKTANRTDTDVQRDESGRRPRRGQAGSPETRHSRSVQENPPAEDRGSDRYSTGATAGSTPSEAPNNELHDAISQADAFMTGAPSAMYPGAGSSSAAMGHPYASSMTAAQGYPSSAGQNYPSSTAPGQNYYSMYDESGRATPRPLTQGPTTVPTAAADQYQYEDTTVSRPGNSRQADLHAAFTVEHSTRFQPGMVFKIEWCEPLGAAPPRSEVITNPVRMEQDGMQFYQGVRRFIVVANDEGHCACVPILTYGHKACTKRGVKPLKHGIVYQNGKRPRMVEHEPPLGFRPIAVDLYERTEKLDKESRVNYAKITTVEHNFRVFFIGCVTQADFHNIVRPAVDHCWGKKKR